MQLPDLKDQTVHLWGADFNMTEDEIYCLKNVLSEDEIIKASKFRFQKDKNCSIITRGTLRLLCSKYLNINPQDIAFKFGAFGKPYFNFDTNLKFNVSHSGNIAIISFVNNFDIGADIEYIKDDFDVFDIAQNIFSNLEIETIKKLPKEKYVEAFYRCWTRKESFIKAKAQGLSFALDSFSVSLDFDDKAQLLETKWDPYEKDLWNLFSFSPKSGYIGAISVKGEIDNVQYFNFNDYFKTLPE